MLVKQKENSNLFFNFKMFLYMHLFRIIITFCNKSEPFLKDGICYSYCNNSNSSNECIPENQIIKEQFLNNIIHIGELNNFRYINFATNINGDMIVLTTAYPSPNNRSFFGIKKNGRYFFENELSYFYSKDFSEIRCEGESLFIQISNANNDNNKKEYFFTFGKSNIAELYNFEDYNNTIIPSGNIFEEFIHSFRNSFIKLSCPQDNDKYYYLITGITNTNFYIKKCFFIIDGNNDLIVSCNSTIIILNTFVEMNSCVTTDNHIIICFIYDENKLMFYIYDEQLNKLNSNSNFKDLTSFSFDNFIKSIQYKEEIIILSYYDKNTQNEDWNIYINFIKLEINVDKW